MVIKYSRAQVQLLEGKIQNEIFFFLQERIKVISHIFLFSFRHLKNSKHFDQICQDTKIYNQKLFSMWTYFSVKSFKVNFSKLCYPCCFYSSKLWLHVIVSFVTFFRETSRTKLIPWQSKWEERVNVFTNIPTWPVATTLGNFGCWLIVRHRISSLCSK